MKVESDGLPPALLSSHFPTTLALGMSAQIMSTSAPIYLLLVRYS